MVWKKPSSGQISQSEAIELETWLWGNLQCVHKDFDEPRTLLADELAPFSKNDALEESEL